MIYSACAPNQGMNTSQIQIQCLVCGEILENESTAGHLSRHGSPRFMEATNFIEVEN